MPTIKRTSYDEVPYASHPFPQTHPDRLATVATLLGLRPAPVGRCRVLELGCASGGNLIPMALTLPDSTFLGIDQSQVEVAEGQETIAALGLKNIEMRPSDILDYEPPPAGFDYIVCHGVYSWVPNPVQDKILAICKRGLAAQGVAYISYNTYPGWHMRGMIRDMLSYHARQFVEPLTKVKQARNLLDFLARSVAYENSSYSLQLRQELDLFHRCPDSYLYHEHLEEVNEPIYFHQFAERAAAKGLRYLGEADLRVMVPGNYPPEVANVLHMLAPDVLHLEQYMDFLRNRTFRQTLLCHQRLTPDYNTPAERMGAFHAASPIRPANPGLDPRSSAAEQFQTPDGINLCTSEPLVKAALLCLAEAWPLPVAVETLLQQAKQRLHSNGGAAAAVTPAERQLLGHTLLNFYASASTSLMELYLHPPRFVVQVSELPLASPLVRHQAAASQGQVTNLRHHTVAIGEFERHLLRLLDGTRDRGALVQALQGVVDSGDLVAQSNGAVLKEGPRLQEALGQGLDTQLPAFAQNALLMA